MEEDFEKLKNDFVSWTKLKIRIHLNKKTEEEGDVYFKDREIWWASLGKNIGFEQDGKNDRFERPVIVMKKFGRNTLWCLPLTTADRSGDKFRQLYFKFTNTDGEITTAILSQLRLIDSRRLIRKLSMINEEDFNRIRGEIGKILYSEI